MDLTRLSPVRSQTAKVKPKPMPKPPLEPRPAVVADDIRPSTSASSARLEQPADSTSYSVRGLGIDVENGYMCGGGRIKVQFINSDGELEIHRADGLIEIITKEEDKLPKDEPQKGSALKEEPQPEPEEEPEDDDHDDHPWQRWWEHDNDKEKDGNGNQWWQRHHDDDEKQWDSHNDDDEKKWDSHYDDETKWKVTMMRTGTCGRVTWMMRRQSGRVTRMITMKRMKMTGGVHVVRVCAVML